MSQVPLGLWFLVLTLFIAVHVVSALKWWLLAVRGTGISFPIALRAHFSGLTANLCLPGVAGGDVVRTAVLLNRTADKTRLAIGSVAERVIDTFALLMLTLVAAAVLAASHFGIPSPLLQATVLVAVCALAGGVVAAVAHRFLLDRLPSKLIDAIQHFKSRPGALLSCLGLSLTVQSALILLAIPLAGAIGIEAAMAAWFFGWSLAKIIALLPVSISGIGVREASLATLMAPFGADPATVVGLGLIWQTILIASGILGGLALLLTGAKAGSTAPVSAGLNSSSQ